MIKDPRQKKYSILIALSSFLMLVASCNSNETESKGEAIPIKIDPTKIEVVSGSLDEIVSIESVIPLETNSESYIGDVSLIKLSKTGILIVDRKSQSILIFDHDGSFRSKIRRPGKGPGEYTLIMDIDWIKNKEIKTQKDADDEIVISDVYGKKLIFYSADGDFLSEASYPANLQKIGALTENLICVHIGRFRNAASLEETLSQVLVLNRQGELVKEFFSYESNLSYALGEGFSNGNNGGVSYFKLMDPNIYQINQDLTLDINWSFDFGKYQPDTVELFIPGQAGTEKLMQVTKTNPFISIDKMYQSSKTLMIVGFYRGTANYIFLDNETRNMATMVPDSLGILGTCKNIPIYTPKSSYQESFISIIPATEWTGTPEIKEDDNPVVVLYKVKTL